MRAGGLGKTPKEETDSAKKVSPFTKKHDKPAKAKLKEEDSEMEEIKDMIKQNFSGEDLDDGIIASMAKMIKSKRDKSKPPSKSGGNNSGAPAQPSMQEKKLREAIRNIIKNKMKK